MHLSSAGPRRFLTAAFGLALLAGCTSPAAGPDEPFFTYPPRVYTPTGNVQPGDLISICYNRLTSPAERVTAMIAASCRDPVFVRSDYIGQCTLSAPVRVTYRCSAVDAEAAAPRLPFVPF